MPSWVWIPLVVVGLGLATWAHVAFWTRRYTRPFRPDERLTVETPDGVSLALARLRPAPDGPAGGAPVLCVHGVACNGRTFDFAPDRSLGRTLAAAGFDVYLLDLRGAGSSGRPPRWDFGFFDYVERDVPAVLAALKARTGARRVLWVGHSMGGLIGFEHLAAPDARGEADLAALVAIGSPLNLVGTRADLRGLARLMPLVRWLTPVVHLGFVTRLLSPWAGRLRVYPETLFTNPAQTPGAVLRHFMVEVVHDVSRRVLEELVARLLHDRSTTGRPVDAVRTGLARSPVPTLVLAGAADHIAPLRACDLGAQRAACDHTWVELSRRAGAPVDFGHLDLVVGDAAPTHVYAPIVSFLLARAARCETPRAC
jgi:pimeloyl-ACP methyl ester carboxylesterase